MGRIFAMVDASVNQLSEFGKIAVFLILGTLFVLIAYGISYLLAKSHPSPGKLSTYECGEEPEGSARIQFNNRFYIIALVFLLFDVEIVFLFPWSSVFAQASIMDSLPVWGWFSFIEMSIFIFVLLVGLVYVWTKGDLAWIRSRQTVPGTESKVPLTLYTAINTEEYVVRPFSLPVETEKAAPAASRAPKPAFRPRILKKSN